MRQRAYRSGLESVAVALRPMRVDDLDAVMAIERRAYPFPWTRGIFDDCLRAGYPAWVLHGADGLLGYGVLSIAAGVSITSVLLPFSLGFGLAAALSGTASHITPRRNHVPRATPAWGAPPPAVARPAGVLGGRAEALRMRRPMDVSLIIAF